MSLQNDAPSKYYWAEVFVDGVRAQHRILQGPASREIFVGFTRRMGFGGGERAFCFSMPRPVFEVNGSSSAAPEDPEKLVEIGSVRIDIHETSLRKTVTEAVKSPGLGVAEGQDIDFTPTDKKTAKRCEEEWNGKDGYIATCVNCQRQCALAIIMKGVYFRC